MHNNSMSSNNDMDKMLASSSGTSAKVKIILIVALIIIATAVTVTSYGIFENNASFVKNCEFTSDVFNTNSIIGSQEEALSALSSYTDTSSLKYDKYPVEYDETCHAIQYFFQDTKTHDQYYVCKTGSILKKTPKNCNYEYNFSVVSSAQQIFSNNGT